MGSKLILTGPVERLQVGKRIVTFRIMSGPAVKNAPKGLPLYGQVRYEVQCSARQWRKARAHDQDRSDLIIEGYLKPEVGENGQPYVKVIAMSVVSQLVVHQRKQKQLHDAMCQAEDEYIATFDRHEAEPGPETEQALAVASDQLEKAKTGYLRFFYGTIPGALGGVGKGRRACSNEFNRSHVAPELIVEKVIRRLTSQLGCDVESTLEISARRPEGLNNDPEHISALGFG